MLQVAHPPSLPPSRLPSTQAVGGHGRRRRRGSGTGSRHDRGSVGRMSPTAPAPPHPTLQRRPPEHWDVSCLSSFTPLGSSLKRRLVSAAAILSSYRLMSDLAAGRPGSACEAGVASPDAPAAASKTGVELPFTPFDTRADSPQRAASTRFLPVSAYLK